MSGRQIAVGEHWGMPGRMVLKREVDRRCVSFEALFIAHGIEAMLTVQRSEPRLSLLSLSFVFPLCVRRLGCLSSVAVLPFHSLISFRFFNAQT
jgi:hypothetical protein